MKNKLYKLYKIIYIILIVLILLNFKNSYVYADDEDEEEIKENEINEIIVQTSATPVDEISINAKSAIIYDRTTKQIIWGKNENDKKAMASTTKIMTAIIVLENCNLSDEVTISKNAANTGGSRLKVNKDDKVTVKDLLYGLMLRSGNDAAVALAEYVANDVQGFANLMNKKAEELNLKNTNFVTPHGLDNEEHYTTAYELAILTDYALQNETFCKIVNTKIATIYINKIPRTIYNTNELLGVMPGVNGVKTGFTNNAGRCLVTSCTKDQNQIITVVLGCDTKKQRTSDSIKLIEYAFKNYTRINLEEIIEKEFENWKQINLGRIYINKGKEKFMELKLDTIPIKMLPIKIGEEKNIKIEINAIYNYEAPVKAETKIGNIIVKKDEKIIQVIDIICNKEIEKKDIISYMMEMISSIANYKFISKT